MFRYVPPTMIDKPSPDSRIMKEEIFGPVMPILEFDDIQEVIRFVNERPNPLVLYYYGSTCSKNKKALLHQTSSGQFSINESLFHLANCDLPFGGVQNSGMSAYHGQTGFDNCSHLKAVLDKLPINSFPFSARYPPFTERKKFIMRFLMKNMNINHSSVVRGFLIISAVIALAVLKKKGILSKLNSYLVGLILKYNKITVKN